jgi:hypothetical protein
LYLADFLGSVIQTGKGLVSTLRKPYQDMQMGQIISRSLNPSFQFTWFSFFLKCAESLFGHN